MATRINYSSNDRRIQHVDETKPQEACISCFSTFVKHCSTCINVVLAFRAARPAAQVFDANHTSCMATFPQITNTNKKSVKKYNAKRFPRPGKATRFQYLSNGKRVHHVYETKPQEKSISPASKLVWNIALVVPSRPRAAHPADEFFDLKHTLYVLSHIPQIKKHSY